MQPSLRKETHGRHIQHHCSTACLRTSEWRESSCKTSITWRNQQSTDNNKQGASKQQSDRQSEWRETRRLFLQGFGAYPYFPGYPSSLDLRTGLGKDGNKAGKDVLKIATNLGIGGERPMIITPMVQKQARQFFNCPTLQGAELEDDLGKGSAFVHWDQRLFEVGSHRLCCNELT
jgi:hypothetical protein